MIGGIVSLVASIGVSKIVNNVIKATTPATIGVIEKVFIGVGGIVIDCAIANAVFTNVEAGIDKVKNLIKKNQPKKEIELRCVKYTEEL